METGRKKAALIVLVVAGAVALFLCSGAFAANPTNVSVSANIATTLQLTMPTTSVDFGGGPLAPGSDYTGVITATVNSNKAWSLKVTKDHDLRGTGATPEVIPSGNLTFEATSADSRVTYKASANTPFGDTAVDVVRGNRGSNITSSITYSLRVPWELAPDTYSATHTYRHAAVSRGGGGLCTGYLQPRRHEGPGAGHLPGCARLRCHPAIATLADAGPGSGEV
mgnify:CR=1 FL=1